MSRIPSLDLQLENVKRLLRNMCDAVLSGFNTLIQQFENPNSINLMESIFLDSEIDRLEGAIDSAILQVFATQQPLGYDLRFAYSCAKIAHHVERIGDAVEILSRQLLDHTTIAEKAILRVMLKDTKDLFKRAYLAMFERELSLIQDIHTLDDKIDDTQRKLHILAKNILKEDGKLKIDQALKIISMSSKLEKIADLCCSWAEQIDFVENGSSRRSIKKPKQKIVLVDNCGGILASLSASFIMNYIKDSIMFSVATMQKLQGSILDFTELLTKYQIIPQVFPVVQIHAVEWSQCILMIHIGRFNLTDIESDFIPFKVLKFFWGDIPMFSLNELLDQNKFDVLSAYLTEKSMNLSLFIERIKN